MFVVRLRFDEYCNAQTLAHPRCMFSSVCRTTLITGILKAIRTPLAPPFFWCTCTCLSFLVSEENEGTEQNFVCAFIFLGKQKKTSTPKNGGYGKYTLETSDPDAFNSDSNCIFRHFGTDLSLLMWWSCPQSGNLAPGLDLI